ncbi:Poly [ADP-ribose] polymerase 2 [Perkinsus olseni]|uniref:Poly [ADP-ribose] polymerase 2 n=1 Tax=Perkinsus olseni TaxID=32597 RepID=A0A7J6MWU5_PEROL|nr:Poly [ADP-ribose] polymerase 2 [Perkinsus olseni]KAF4675690.1 Poly [ADP-ribose] polymerase 2 [Perkinsus olseni]
MSGCGLVISLVNSRWAPRRPVVSLCDRSSRDGDCGGKRVPSRSLGWGERTAATEGAPEAAPTPQPFETVFPSAGSRLSVRGRLSEVTGRARSRWLPLLNAMPSRSSMLRSALVVSAVSFVLVLIYRGHFPMVGPSPEVPLVLIPLPPGHSCHHSELPSRQSPPYCNDPLRGVSGTLCPVKNCEGECDADPWCREERSRYRLLGATTTADGLLRVRVAGPLRSSVVTGELGCNDELFGVLRGPAILPVDFTVARTVVAGPDCLYLAVAQLVVGGQYFLSVSVERIADHAALEPDVSLPDRARVCSKVAKNPTRVASLDMFWPLNSTAVYLGAEVLPRLSRIVVEALPVSIDCSRLPRTQPQWLHYTVVERAMRDCELEVVDYDRSDNYVWFNPGRKPFLLGKLANKWLRKVMRKKKVLFIGDSTVEDIWRFWTQSEAMAELLQFAKVGVHYESVWGSYELMYSGEDDPFMCDGRTMRAGGWRSIDAIAERVKKARPTVVVIGENLHTLKKVSIAYHGKLLKKLFGAVRKACPNCVIIFKPTTQPVGRRCACPKDLRVSWCAFDIFYGRKRLREANAVASRVGREFDVVAIEDAYEMTLARQELSRDGIHWSKSFFNCHPDPAKPCDFQSCLDYASGNWQPEPLGAAVTNKTAATNPIVSQRKNFFRDLYPDSPLAITSGIIIDIIVEQLHSRGDG